MEGSLKKEEIERGAGGCKHSGRISHVSWLKAFQNKGTERRTKLVPDEANLAHTLWEEDKRGGNRDVDWLQVEEPTNGRLSLETLDIFKKKIQPAKRLIQ